MSLAIEPERDVGLQGHYAGIATRSAAFVIDLVAIIITYDVLASAIEFVVSRLRGQAWQISDLPVVFGLFLGLWALLYCSYPVAAGGRTLGMAIAGLRVVRSDGRRVGWRGALLRVLALPLSFLTLGIGFLLILIRPDRRALQDLIGGTAVVYAWDARTARLRFLARFQPPSGAVARTHGADGTAVRSYEKTPPKDMT
jgi:uncharacterized RDD family membrane protein YckC